MRYGVSINEYLVAVYVWSVYTECMHGMPSERPVRVAVPVNLRPYFNSITTKNFFVMVSAEFHPTKEIYTFEEVLKIVSVRACAARSAGRIWRSLFSYNVSNEKLLAARIVPLFLKNLAMRLCIHNLCACKHSDGDQYREYLRKRGVSSLCGDVPCVSCHVQRDST